MVNRLRTDKDYIDAGVEPPEHIVHEGSEQVATDQHVHLWKHKDGPWLHCDESEGQNAHGIPFDHLHKILVGTSADGRPILKDLILSDKVPRM